MKKYLSQASSIASQASRLSLSMSALLLSIVLMGLSWLMARVADPLRQFGHDTMEEIHEEIHTSDA